MAYYKAQQKYMIVDSIADMLLSPCRSFVDHIYIVYHIYFEASGKAINARADYTNCFF